MFVVYRKAWCTDLIKFMFAYALISSMTAIYIVGWPHHYNYDGTDFVYVVTCVVVFLHNIIYVYFRYNCLYSQHEIKYLSIYLHWT